MSGIDHAIDSAVTNLKAMQQGFGLASINIANAEDPNFTKRSMNLVPSYTGGQITGVKIQSIERFYDKFLDQAIREGASQYHKEETVRNYIEQIMGLIGSVNDESNPNLVIDKVFDLVNRLSLDPSELSIKDETRNRFKHLAFVVSDLANSAFKYQYEIDRDLEDSTQTINGIIEQLNQVNTDINSAMSINGEATNLYERRDALLKDLANYLDCRVAYSPKGQVEVSLSDGTTIVGNYKTSIEFDAQEGVDNFKRKDYMNPMTVYSYNSAGDITSRKDIVAINYDDSSVSTILKGGKIKGLLEVRDKYIPKYLEMLNNLATHLSNEFNKIHNKGSGYPPLTTYQSTRPVNGAYERTWEGNVKFALVDKFGKPIQRDDGSLVKPLDLNLSKLYTNSAVEGRFDIRTVMNEFNGYFKSDACAPRASLGRVTTAKNYETEYLIRDIKLVAREDLSTTPLGVFKFDLELDSDSQFDTEFQVLDVIVKDSAGAVVSGAVTSAIPDAFNMKAGTRVRTGQEVEVDFNAAVSAGGPFKIELLARVAGNDGTIATGKFTYIIDDTPGTTEITNERYIADATAGSTTGDAIVIESTNNQPYAEVRLVDEDGNDILNDTQTGTLIFKTYNSDMRLVIQDDTSKELGLSEIRAVATNLGFGHYLGINDLFAQSYDGTDNPALNFKVRDDIVAVSTNLATGQLAREASKLQNKTIAAKAAVGNITFDIAGALPSDGDTLNVNGSTFTFWDTITPMPTNPITIVAGDWGATLDNIMTELQASNSNTADKADQATYTLSTDTIEITHNTIGITGNSFAVSTNFATITASLNGRKIATVDSVNLYGGTAAQDITTVTPYGFGLSIGADQLIKEMTKINNKSLFFEGSDLTVSVNTTLTGFVSAFVSTLSADLSLAKVAAENTKNAYDNYFNRFRQAGGVNIDDQMVDVLRFQHSYSASAKIISVSQKLMDTLLNSL
jgi:flagellar hook-associated protein 1 FlgK